MTATSGNAAGSGRDGGAGGAGSGRPVSRSAGFDGAVALPDLPAGLDLGGGFDWDDDVDEDRPVPMDRADLRILADLQAVYDAVDPMPQMLPDLVLFGLQAQDFDAEFARLWHLEVPEAHFRWAIKSIVDTRRDERFLAGLMEAMRTMTEGLGGEQGFEAARSKLTAALGEIDRPEGRRAGADPGVVEQPVDHAGHVGRARLDDVEILAHLRRGALAEVGGEEAGELVEVAERRAEVVGDDAGELLELAVRHGEHA